MLCTSTTPFEVFEYISAVTWGVIWPVALVWALGVLCGVFHRD